MLQRPHINLPERFQRHGDQAMMHAIVTLGRGDYTQLRHTRVPVPTPGPGEVLLRVLASSVNNTDINTRLGWYDAGVTVSTQAAATVPVASSAARPDSGWDRPSPFPFIQGTDCCGLVVGVADGVNPGLLGRRVLVRPCMRPHGFETWDNLWLGSDLDGAFAEFVKVPASEVFPVDSPWSDAELGVIPCAFGTAENMLHRTAVSAREHVLITGSSGGVGVAALQLAKRRGAWVSAITTPNKMAALRELGAEQVLDRADDVLACLGERTVDVVIDTVAGEAFPALLAALKRGGRYAACGAIAGPVVALDLRVMYLKNLNLIGCTAWAEPVFTNLIRYIEGNEFKPLLAGTFALDQIEQAQREFLEKRHIGKIALLPPMACPGVDN